MNQGHDAGKTRTAQSVIDYEFYWNRGRGLHEDTVRGGIGDFVYCAITRLAPALHQGGFRHQLGYC
jgi:hypothetical protein